MPGQVTLPYAHHAMPSMYTGPAILQTAKCPSWLWPVLLLLRSTILSAKRGCCLLEMVSCERSRNKKVLKLNLKLHLRFISFSCVLCLPSRQTNSSTPYVTTPTASPRPAAGKRNCLSLGIKQTPLADAKETPQQSLCVMRCFHDERLSPLPEASSPRKSAGSLLRNWPAQLTLLLLLLLLLPSPQFTRMFPKAERKK